MKKFEILVLNGPNINMLGIREPGLYGKETYNDLVKLVRSAAKKKSVKVSFYQSNEEGALVDKIQKSLEQEIKKGRVRKIYEISLGYIFYCEPGVYVPDSGEYDYADIFYDVKPMWRVNCLKASGAQKELEEAYSDGTVTDDERNTVAYTQFLVDAQTGEIIGQSDAADRSMFPGFLTWEDVNK